MPEEKRADTVYVPSANQTSDNRTGAFLLKWAPHLIVLITALVYSKAILNGFVTFDDYQFVVKNPVIQDSSLSGILKIFTTFNTGKYQPFTTLSFVLENRFFGLNPLVFHLTNVILHLLSTFILYRVTERLSGNRITAIVVALLFGIHPMHVEDVAWVAERKDMLYAFFYLCAIFAYLRYIECGYRIKYYIVAFFLFLVSLFSKTEAITLPLVLFIIDIYKGRKLTFKLMLEKVPFLFFSFFIGALGFRSEQQSGFLIAHPIATYGFLNRIFLFTTVPSFYIVKLFAPFYLSAEHYYPDMHNGMLPWSYYASLPFMLLMTWLVVRRSSFRKEMMFGAAFFLAILSFMPQIIFAGPALTPERYSYLSYIGIFYIIGQWGYLRRHTKWKKPLIAVFSAITILWCVLTWLRIDVWQDSITLYTDVIEKNDDIQDLSFFYWIRGKAYVADNNLPAAIEDYTHVISLQQGPAEVYEALGDLNFREGYTRAAIENFDAAIRLGTHNSMTYCNRAAAKAITGDFSGALNDYNLFLALKPDDDIARTARGMTWLNLKDTVDACKDWENAAAHGNKTAAQLLQQWRHKLQSTDKLIK